MHGRHKHVAVRHDNEDGHTWAIWRNGRILLKTIATRRQAREHAQWLDEHEKPPPINLENNA
jgi:hypothetical protein